jgi:hypothetical protein
MMPGRMLRVLVRVQLMRVRQVRVVRRLLMIARFMMLRRFRMMVRGHPGMMRRLAMFVGCLL